MHQDPTWAISRHVDHLGPTLTRQLTLAQFLFIDLFLILPIAIFSPPALLSHSLTWLTHCPVGWTGPYPILCRKRPTASLVSRKVLAPLLGQILLCILIQSVAIGYVRRQRW